MCNDNKTLPSVGILCKEIPTHSMLILLVYSERSDGVLECKKKRKKVISKANSAWYGAT